MTKIHLIVHTLAIYLWHVYYTFGPAFKNCIQLFIPRVPRHLLDHESLAY